MPDPLRQKGDTLTHNLASFLGKGDVTLEDGLKRLPGVDADGQAVTDRMKVCLQVGQHCTRSYPYRKFREDTEGYESLAPDNPPLLRAESFCFMP